MDFMSTNAKKVLAKKKAITLKEATKQIQFVS
jgi:hypothetical protein